MRARLGMANVSFVTGDIRTVDLPGNFDAAIGRLVLIYSASPVETLTRVASHVRPGGPIAFEEPDLPLTVTDPIAMPLFTRFFGLASAVYGRSGAQESMGRRLLRSFVEAGIGAPTMWALTPMGGAAGWPGYEWFTASFRSALPLIEQFGLDTAAELLDTLSERLEAEVAWAGMPLLATPHVCAWARKPKGASMDRCTQTSGTR